MENLNHIISHIINIVKEISSDSKASENISDDMPLVGSESCIDSMQLIELCIELEEKADDMGFEFDWTSEHAMSKSRSIFKSIRSLAEEFLNQSSVGK